jgi:endonuclease YncB( thermonuclease family)
MGQEDIRTISLFILFLSLTTSIQVVNAIQVDLTGYVSYVHDGDTFDIDSGNTAIRLADIDAPEYGEPGYDQAKWYLFDLIYNKTVYLDQSTLNGYSGDRLVCVVYIEYDSTHYLNINKKMLDSGLADLWDHENDFNPETWTLLVPKNSVPSPISYKLIIEYPDGSGSTNPTSGIYTYSEVTSIQVYATPSNGWSFDHWNFDGINIGSQNPYNVNMNTDHQLRAVFTQSQTPARAVIIDQASVSDLRCDVSSWESVKFHFSWDNGTSVSKGRVSVGEYSIYGYETWYSRWDIDEKGWISFPVIFDSVGTKSWDISEVNCSGITDFTQTFEPPVIIWDFVNVTLSVSDDRIDVGSKADVRWTAFYEYDGSPFQGKVNLKIISSQTSTPTPVGKNSYQVESIEDEKYGLTEFTSNQVDCVWDRVKITQGGVSNQLTRTGNMETVWFKAVYEYDNEEFTGEPTADYGMNKIFVNGIPLVWSSFDKSWKYSTKLDDNGKLTFEVTGVEDMQYKLTTFIDAAGPQSITWEKPFLETPGGIASIAAVLAIIAAGVIFFLRKRI